MKKLLFFLITILALFFNANAQEYPCNEYGEIEFTEVIVNSELPQNILHSNAKTWAAKIFGDYKRSVQLEDNDNFKLIVKGASEVPYISKSAKGMIQTMYKINYTITIESREGRYKYLINDIFLIRIMSILGNITNGDPISPLLHLKNIDNYSQKLIILKETDISKMKKNEIEKHNEDINDYERLIKDEQIFFEFEYREIQNIINSLKIGMNINNEW